MDPLYRTTTGSQSHKVYMGSGLHWFERQAPLFGSSDHLWSQCQWVTAPLLSWDSGGFQHKISIKACLLRKFELSIWRLYLVQRWPGAICKVRFTADSICGNIGHKHYYVRLLGRKIGLGFKMKRKTACSDARNQVFQDAQTPELSLESFPSKFPFIDLEPLKTKGKQKLQAMQNLRISKSLKWPT